MITSKQNKIIKQILSLKQRRERELNKLFVAEGLRFVCEIPVDYKIAFYAVSESFDRKNNLSYFQKRAETVVISDTLFDSLCDTQTPQGILAVCYQKEADNFLEQNNKNGFYILAEELNDPGNLGTIIRTADAGGADGIFLSKGCVDCYNPKVLRATMGSIFHVPIVQSVELKEIIEKMKKNDITVFAAHLEGTQYPYEFDFKKGSAILIGNEANGLTDKTSAYCNHYIKIPMIGNAESLNASVAAGVLIYEVVRQRLQL